MNKLLSQSHGSSSVHLGMKMWWRSQWGRSGIEATLDLGNVTMDDHKKKKIISNNRSKHFCCTSCSCVKMQHLRPPAETRPSALPLTCIYFARTGLMFLFQRAAALSFRVTNTEHSAHTVACFRLPQFESTFPAVSSFQRKPESAPNLYYHKYRHSNCQFICICAERCRNNPPTATRTISMAAAGWRPTNSPRLCNKLFYSGGWNYHWADCCWNK